MNYLEPHLVNEDWPGFHTLPWRNALARCSVFYNFMLEGFLMGIFSSFIPNIQDRLNLSDSKLGLSILFIYLGTAIVTPLTGYSIRKLGSKITVFIGALLFGLSLPLIAISTSFIFLSLSCFSYGWWMGFMDISQNSAGVLTEIVADKPLLGSFHGSYSIAAALASLIGGALSSTNLGIVTVFVSTSALSVVLSTIASSWMYNFKQDVMITEFGHARRHARHEHTVYSEVAADDVNNSTPERSKSRSHSHSSRQGVGGGEYFIKPAINYSPTRGDYTANKNHNLSPLMGSFDGEHGWPTTSSDGGKASASFDSNISGSNKSTIVDPNSAQSDKRALMFFSLVGFLGAFGESSIVTWIIVYYKRYFSVSSTMASFGFTAFMVCMAIGRFCLDYLRRTVGRQYIVRLGGVLATSGLTLAVLSTELPFPFEFACIGMATTGLGLSSLIPTMFSSAGHLKGVHAGTSIAIVGGFSYSGSIISSPLVGIWSDWLGSLRYALLIDAILLSLIIPLSWGIPHEDIIDTSIQFHGNTVENENESSENNEVEKKDGSTSVLHQNEDNLLTPSFIAESHLT